MFLGQLRNLVDSCKLRTSPELTSISTLALSVLCHPIKSCTLLLWVGYLHSIEVLLLSCHAFLQTTQHNPVFSHGQSIIDGTIKGKNEDDVTSPTVTQWTATAALCRVPSKTVSPKQLIIQNINRGAIIAILWFISIPVKEIKARAWYNFDSRFALKTLLFPVNSYSSTCEKWSRYWLVCGDRLV